MRLKNKAALAVVLALAFLGTTHSQERMPRRLKIITSVTQMNYGSYIEIVITGAGFPVPRGSCQIMVGDTICIPGSCWSTSKACGGLPFNIHPGKTYPVRIVDSAITKNAITGSRDYFLLTNLYDIHYSGRPLPGAEIEVLSAINLGDKGNKVVKFDNTVVPTLQWQSTGFKIHIPSHVTTALRHTIWIEEGGKLISNKIPLEFPRPEK